MTRRRAQEKPTRTTDFAALVKVVRSASSGERESVEHRRRMLADLCRLLGRNLNACSSSPKPDLSAVPPRARQVLELLLKGRSEKEVARELGMSVHTVHVHVKSLYKRFNVTSRAELLATCLGTPH